MEYYNYSCKQVRFKFALVTSVLIIILFMHIRRASKIERNDVLPTHQHYEQVRESVCYTNDTEGNRY